MVHPKDGSNVCQRCYSEKYSNRNNVDYIPTFSKENLMHFGEIPECMHNLTNVEIASIRRISPLVQMYCRKSGNNIHSAALQTKTTFLLKKFILMSTKSGLTGIRGNVISFEQDLTEIATVLPRLPPDLNIINLQPESKKKYDLKIRPKVREC